MNWRALNRSLTDVLPSSVCDTNTHQSTWINKQHQQEKTQSCTGGEVFFFFYKNSNKLPECLVACCTLQRPVELYRHWKEESDWLMFLQLDNGPVRLPVHLKQSAFPVYGGKNIHSDYCPFNLKHTRQLHFQASRHVPNYTKKTLLRSRLHTLSMLCCSRSFMRTTSCCLNISLSCSGSDGGGVIWWDNEKRQIKTGINGEPWCPA